MICGTVDYVPDSVTAQLAPDGRLVTVLRGADGLGRITVLQRVGDRLSRQALSDAATPPLAAFARDPGFVF